MWNANYTPFSLRFMLSVIIIVASVCCPSNKLFCMAREHFDIETRSYAPKKTYCTVPGVKQILSIAGWGIAIISVTVNGFFAKNLFDQQTQKTLKTNTSMNVSEYMPWADCRAEIDRLTHKYASDFSAQKNFNRDLHRYYKKREDTLLDQQRNATLKNKATCNDRLAATMDHCHRTTTKLKKQCATTIPESKKKDSNVLQNKRGRDQNLVQMCIQLAYNAFDAAASRLRHFRQPPTEKKNSIIEDFFPARLRGLCSALGDLTYDNLLDRLHATPLQRIKDMDFFQKRRAFVEAKQQENITHTGIF